MFLSTVLSYLPYIATIYSFWLPKRHRQDRKVVYGDIMFGVSQTPERSNSVLWTNCRNPQSNLNRLYLMVFSSWTLIESWQKCVMVNFWNKPSVQNQGSKQFSSNKETRQQNHCNHSLSHSSNLNWTVVTLAHIYSVYEYVYVYMYSVLSIIYVFMWYVHVLLILCLGTNKALLLLGWNNVTHVFGGCYRGLVVCRMSNTTSALKQPADDWTLVSSISYSVCLFFHM